MTTIALNRLIGRALTERSFREQLLLRPQAAIRKFPLSTTEQTHINSLNAMDLEDFSRLLSERLRDSLDSETN